MVPQEVYNGLLSRQHETTEPLVTQLSNIDQQVQDVLSMPGMPADIKHAQYNQILHRYRHLKDEQRKPLHVQLDQPQATLPVPVHNLIEGIPPRYRSKARVLADHLQRHPSDFQWSDRGELVMAGKEIPGSSIVDLVHDFVRPRETVNPAPGAEEFAALLQQTNAPREGVGNNARLFRSPVLGVPRRSTSVSSASSEYMPTVSATPTKKKKKTPAKRPITDRSPPVVQKHVAATDQQQPSTSLVFGRSPRIKKKTDRFDAFSIKKQ